MWENDWHCRACDRTHVVLLGQAHEYPSAECSRCGLVFIPEVERRAAEASYGAGGGPAHGVPANGWSTGPGSLQPAQIVWSNPWSVLIQKSAAERSMP